MKKSLIMAFYLTLVTFVCGVILFYINTLTQPLIVNQAKKEQTDALAKVMVKAASFEEQENGVYKAISKEDKLCGYIFKVSPVGFVNRFNFYVIICQHTMTTFRYM